MDSPFLPCADPPAAAVPESRPRRRRLAWALLLGPVLLYMGSLWVIWPVPFSLVTPLALVVTPLVIAVSRRHVLEQLRKLRFEFALLALLAVLSVLSIVNSNEPLRTLRILYPSLVPFMIFGSFVVIRSISPKLLLAVPRYLIAGFMLFSLMPFLASYFVPGLKSIVYGDYRLHALFESSIQHAISLGVVLPLVVTEFALAKRALHRAAWGALVLALGYTLFQSGTKTPMFVGSSLTAAMYIVMKLRSQGLPRTIVMFCAFGAVVFLVVTFGVDVAERLHPEIGGKIRSIVEDGVTSYQSVESRKLLWEEAIAEGRAHWLIGSGAGERVLGLSHAHNLVLDYFKGIGIFGAVGVFLLCLAIFARAIAKGLRILGGKADEVEKRIWACYVGAVIYVICNQMSDSFGPSTIGFLWVVYLAGVLSERRRGTVVPNPPGPKGAVVVARAGAAVS